MSNWRKWRCTWTVEMNSNRELLELMVLHTFWSTLFLCTIIYMWNFWCLLIFGFGIWISASGVSYAIDELIDDRLKEEPYMPKKEDTN